MMEISIFCECPLSKVSIEMDGLNGFESNQMQSAEIVECNVIRIKAMIKQPKTISATLF